MCASSAWTGASPHIDKSDLMCKRGCGYYGNPAWDGHCSKCFKELLNKKQKRPVFDPAHIRNKVSRSVSDVTEFPAKATSLVSRKLDKQQLQLGKRTKIVKDIFRISHSPKAEPSLLPQLSSESQAVYDELQSHLKNLCEDAKSGVAKRIKLFTEKISKLGGYTPVDDLGEMFHEFYTALDAFLDTNSSSWRLLDEDSCVLKDLIEKYITTRLYNILSTNVHAQCEEKDLSLQERIRSLMWVTCYHLECKIDEKNAEIRTIFDEVINDLIEIDSRRTPSGKLSCLVSASNKILCLLKQSCDGTLASADDFLPALIYCLLKANPPLLQSNICYVTNFAQEATLQTGEAAYFFTNLCCAVSFIEKLTAESLCLSDVEFDHFMSGNALPANALDDSYVPDAFKIMGKCLDNMTVLENRMDLVIEGYDQVLVDIEEFHTNLSSEIKASNENAPLIVVPRKVDIDEPVAIQDLLPRPLQPQTINDPASMPPGIDWSYSSAKNCPHSLDDLNESKLDLECCSSVYSQLPNTDSSACKSVCTVVSPSYTSLPLEGEQAMYLEGLLSDVRSIDSQSPASMINSKTTSFTLQGETIHSIPCNTGLETIQSIPCNTGLLTENLDLLTPIQKTSLDVIQNTSDPFSPIQGALSDPFPPIQETPPDPFSPIQETPSDPFSPIQETPPDPFSPIQETPLDPFYPIQETPSDPFSPIQETPSDPFSPIQKTSADSFQQITSSNPLLQPSKFHNLPPPLLPMNSSPVNIIPEPNKD